MRVQILDGRGDLSDEGSGGLTCGPPGAVGQFWIVSAFPRRSRIVRIACLATNAQGHWIKAAEFRVPNPAWAEYPQWDAETLPVTKQDKSLAVTLKVFQSGWRMPGPSGLGDAATAGRGTRLVFSF